MEKILNQEEVDFATEVGKKRQRQAEERDYERKYDQEEEAAPINHIWGALAEMTAAKVLGRYWTGAFIDDIHSDENDVGPIEVKHTQHWRGCLILHEEYVETKPGKPFLLVVGDIKDSMELKGWRFPEDFRDGEWRTPETHPTIRFPGWFLKQEILDDWRKLEAGKDWDFPF